MSTPCASFPARGLPRLNRLDQSKTSELKSGASRPSLSGNKTSNVLFYHEWGGWGAIFYAIVLFQGQSQFATFISKAIVNVFSQWQSRQRRVPTVDGRSRARHRRALIRNLVRTYIESSLLWLRIGCLRPSETPVRRSVRQLASRAALHLCSLLGRKIGPSSRSVKSCRIASLPWVSVGADKNLNHVKSANLAGYTVPGAIPLK